jgi:predicted RNase H-like HicB family nuclease
MYWHGCRDLPELNSYGNDRESAISEALDAIETTLSIYVDQRRVVPVASPIKLFRSFATTIFFPQLISSFSDFRIVNHCHSSLSRYLILGLKLADPKGMCSWLILSFG